MWQEHSAALTEFIADSERYIVAELDRTGIVVDCSLGFCLLLGRKDKPVGSAFFELFIDERSEHCSGPPAVGYLAVQARPPGVASRLQAQVIPSGEGYLVVAEQVNLEQDVLEKLAKLNDEMTNLMRQLHKEKAALERSLARIKRLEGIISICSYCHRIRNEEQSWQRLEEYIIDHSDAMFSHGMCPECETRHFGYLDDE